MIPLVSSICYGPLGVCQLPRFWWKVLLRNADLLDAEYPDYSSGLDRGVLEKLGLDKEVTLTYLRNERPTYLDFEAWVLDQEGGSLDQSAVDEWNGFVRTRVHMRPEKRAEVYRDIGMEDDGTLNSAVILNGLQDWQLFYKRDLSTDFSALRGQVVPLIASIDYGPLEVCQLPRTWHKVILKAKGLLHPDYPDCGDGLDARMLAVLKLDREATVGYLRENLPSYLEFEGWVLEQNGGAIDQEAAEAWNRSIRERIHHEWARATIHATVGREDDGTITSAVILNHIEDWHLAHAGLVGSLR